MYLRAVGRRFKQMNAYFLVMNSKRCINERRVVKGSSRGDGKKISRSCYSRSVPRVRISYSNGGDWGQVTGSCSSCLGSRLETAVPLEDFPTSLDRRLFSVEPVLRGLRYIITLSLGLQKFASR